MLFSFSTFNHCRQGKIIVEDITRIMGYQMTALGHEASWTEHPSFIPAVGGFNVILESFADDPNTIRQIAAAHSAGCRFLYVATEEPTDNGFNHGLEPAMVERQAAFAEAAQYCDGILHLVPGEHVTRWYGQFAPTAYAELGHAALLDQPVGDAEPTYDFGFFGKMTWRRGQMLDRLHATVVRIDTLDVPRETRDRLMRQAKVIVQIRANEEWGMVSSTRCAASLNLGRPVVAEPHPDPRPWDQVVHFSESIDAFFADAAAAARDWRAIHAIQRASFERTLTPEVCIGLPLRKIGIA